MVQTYSKKFPAHARSVPMEISGNAHARSVPSCRWKKLPALEIPGNRAVRGSERRAQKMEKEKGWN